MICAVVCQVWIKRFWLASIAGGVVASLLNILWEMWRAHFLLRPVALFWLPGIFIEGFLVAAMVCCLVGLPFKMVRRRRKKI